MWLKKVLNFAQITFPLPLKVVVALQYKWLSHRFIHSAKISRPFSLDSLLRTFLHVHKKIRGANITTIKFKLYIYW